MDTLENITVWFGGLILLLIVAMGGCILFKEIKNGIGTVSQADAQTTISSYEEKYGCVYYTDVFDSEGKVCGNYNLKIYK